MIGDDRGSTVPLILGFFVLAALLAAAAVAAGDAFVQQRGLQSVCDGAALAAAAGSADLDRGSEIRAGAGLHFAGAEAAVDAYLARDPGRRAVRATTSVVDGGRTIRLRCVEVRHIAFGALFGKAAGVRHVVTSSAQAPLSTP